MKIIGEGNDVFILLASKSEVANLVGYYSHYSDGARSIRVGDEIAVHKMYQQLRELAGMRGQLDAARRTLESSAKMLELVQPVIPVVTVEEPKP